MLSRHKRRLAIKYSEEVFRELRQGDDLKYFTRYIFNYIYSIIFGIYYLCKFQKTIHEVSNSQRLLVAYSEFCIMKY